LIAAAAGGTSTLSVAGLIVGAVGLIAGLAGAVAFLTGASRKAIAEQRDQDIASQGVSIGILNAKVKALESELAAAQRVIENLTSKIKSDEATVRLIESLEYRLKQEGK